MIKAFLFDVDGVLAHTEDWHQRATSEAAGFDVDCSGGGSTQCKLRRAGIREEEIERIYLRKRDLYHAIVDSVKVDLELHDLLHKIPLKKAACSNSSKLSCHKLLHRLGVATELDLIVTGGDVDRLKPAPDIYLEALGRLQLLPSECVVFEDSDEGFRAAVAAGIDSVVMCDRSTLIKEVKRWL